MKGLKELMTVISVVTGLMLTSNIGADEVILDDNIEEIFYEEELSLFDFLNEEEDVVLELVPEKVVTSDYYNMIATQTLTEEEVLEALAGLSAGKSAVERALAVNIVGSNNLYQLVFNALSDNEESVRTEAEFFSKKFLQTAF